MGMMLEKLNQSEKNFMIYILVIRVLNHKKWITGFNIDEIYLHAG